jgi:hypothetical protein
MAVELPVHCRVEYSGWGGCACLVFAAKLPLLFVGVCCYAARVAASLLLAVVGAPWCQGVVVLGGAVVGGFAALLWTAQGQLPLACRRAGRTWRSCSQSSGACFMSQPSLSASSLLSTFRNRAPMPERPCRCLSSFSSALCWPPSPSG